MTLNPSDGRNDFYEGMNDASSQQDDTRTRIDFSRSDLPKPWVPQTAKLYDALRRKHQAEVDALERLAGRRLNQSEYEGIAYWSCKEAQIRSRGIPLGMAFGAYRAYATREQNRFPFWKPKEGFDFSSVRIGSQKVMEGQLARIFWNTARYTAYGAIAGPFMAILFTGSWGISAANLGRLQDPRTKPLMTEIIKMAQETRAQRMQQNMPQNMPANSSRDMAQRTQSSYPTSNDTDSPVSNIYNDSTPQDDPYSPQSSQLSSDLANYGMSNSTENTAPFSPTPRSQQPSRPAYTGTNSVDKQSNESPQFFDNDYDDASPTAAYPSPSPSGRSAWDRVRTGSSTTSNPPSRHQSTSNGRQASYQPSAEADTRSQAQKDFDDSIERERQGRNFD